MTNTENIENMTVGLDNGTYPPPVRNYKEINWTLVSEELHNEFHKLWDTAYSSDPIDGELYCMLDVLGWMINQQRFTKDTTFDEAWKQLVPIYSAL